MIRRKSEILEQVIRESFNDDIDKDTSLILVNIIFASDIYFSDVSGAEDLDWVFESTQRGACAIVASALQKGLETEEDSGNLLAIYNREVRDLYRLPPRLEDLRGSIEEKLLQHAWLDRIVRRDYG